MKGSFDGLSASDLEHLADALESGRVGGSPSGASLSWVPGDRRAAAAASLRSLSDDGMAPRHVARLLRELAAERERLTRARDDIALVWSGPELPGSAGRDTAPVVESLFAAAEESVLIATYAVHDGRKVFATLAARMEALASLRVRMFLHVDPPEHGEDEAAARRRVRASLERQWPGARMPEVFYDPRTLRRTVNAATGRAQGCSLHAKCVVADGERVLVTSANFTEAAQARNIEVGVTLRDRGLAGSLVSHFESLVSAGKMLPL